jgi:excisionase family DNA binding protein
MPSPSSEPDESLLRPREVAALFGVRPTTIARWAREGRLRPLLTPGGHRRYRSMDVRELLGIDEVSPEQQKFEEDAARLYDQGWNIRQVAARFGTSYGVMRRILASHTTLRPRGGPERPPPSVKHHPSTDDAHDAAG